MTKRANSNRTGGPKTAQGKMVAARNSTRLGAYTAQVILPGESPEEFAELEALFLDDFQPQGVTEAALVRDLAVITWKKMRLEGIEHRQILQTLQEPISEYDFNMAGLTVVKGMEDFIWDPYLVDDVDVPVFQEYATQMRLLASGERDEAAIAALEAKFPDSYSRLVAEMKAMGMKTVNPKAIAEVNYKDDAKADKAKPVDDAISLIRKEAEKILWAAEHQGEILEAHARIRDRRLIGRIGIEKYDRANDYLAKSFYKTLSELRKHQEWHRKQQVIDVTPEPAREK
jgi:hypothetical protein